ncbi:MAG TPA: hypothetical protein VMN76_02700 [Acidobacteriota bacterium]|nr:hypothetical protein [Acidobacteriota bacterium]
MKLLSRVMLAAGTLLLLAAPVMGKEVNFRLDDDLKLNGVELKSGRYKLVINGDGTAEIFRGKTLVTTAKVELKSLDGVLPNAVNYDKNLNLREIRTKDERVVFVQSGDSD